MLRSHKRPWSCKAPPQIPLRRRVFNMYTFVVLTWRDFPQVKAVMDRNDPGLG